MRKMNHDEQILRASKEIMFKFIETGRISPTGFPEAFKTIYRTVDETVKRLAVPDTGDENTGEASE